MPEVIAETPGFRQGDRIDFVDIRVCDGLLIIEIAGAPDTVKVLDGMRAGYEGGWIRTDMPTLVDVSGFQGKIDWTAIKRVSELAACRRQGAAIARRLYQSRLLLRLRDQGREHPVSARSPSHVLGSARCAPLAARAADALGAALAAA